LHFPWRHFVALVVALAVGWGVWRLGAVALLRLAPWLYLLSLAAVAAVFVPGLGVRAAGAHRWLRLGAWSFAPAPLLVWSSGLLASAWGRVPSTDSPREGRRFVLVLVALLIALLAFVREPDFSAAGALVVTAVAALGGLGTAGRRLLPVALAGALILAVVASRFPYVEGRIAGFRAPAADRRGKGFEVLALERSSLQTAAAGLGHGYARRALSSPASDYAFAVAREELGWPAAAALLGSTLAAFLGALAVGVVVGRQDRRLRALAFASGFSFATPAFLHIAVCSRLVPIIGVSLPLVSYDPGAVVAAGLAFGAMAAVQSETA
jgi:cell division protein FtsW (lipid II flippase)